MVIKLMNKQKFMISLHVITHRLQLVLEKVNILVAIATICEESTNQFNIYISF